MEHVWNYVVKKQNIKTFFLMSDYSKYPSLTKVRNFGHYCHCPNQLHDGMMKIVGQRCTRLRNTEIFLHNTVGLIT